MAGPLSTQKRVVQHVAKEIYGQLLEELESLDFKVCSGNLASEIWETMDSDKKKKSGTSVFLIDGLKMWFF